MHTSFRPEIEGLRALAVLPVLLFHVGAPWMSGGFIGVDVFFVISGFLITGILARDAELGHLSIAKFYERRVRRIAPALLTVFGASTIAGAVLLFPSQLVSFASSLLAAEAFVSNIWFWRMSGYFAAQGDILPLLHTWSLAVEEQFYLFIPIIVAVLGRRTSWLRAVIIALALGSFITSVIAVPRTQGAAFYLLPTRAWELLLGSVVAMGVVPRPRRPGLRNSIAWLGLIMIAASIMLLDEKVLFPGLTAAPAVLGTALFLWGADDKLSSGRVMALPPLRFVGSISYSLYLWHWPIIVLLRQYLGKDLTFWSSAMALALSFLTAAATWWWVERPTRDRSIWPTRLLLTTTGAGAVALAAAAAGIIMFKGLPSRFSSETLRLEAGSRDYSPIATRCGMSKTSIDDKCHLGRGDPSFILAGDSHAGGIAEAVDVAARAARHGGILSSYNACPALVGWRPTQRSAIDRQGCALRNKRLFDRLRADPKITTLILASYWPPIARKDNGTLQAALDETVRVATAAGKRVVVLHNLPEPGFDVPWHLAVASAHSRIGRRYIDRPTSPLTITPGATSVDLAKALCSGNKCALQTGGAPLYVDSNHLSAHANSMVVGPFLMEQPVFTSVRVPDEAMSRVE